MGIEPESKDWTWVLSATCFECGANVGTYDIATCAQTLWELQPQWREEIQQPGVTNRVSRDTWSRLEYGAHVRDALAVFAERVELMLTQESPTFADWDQDAAAADYGSQDPRQVAAEVANAIGATAQMLEQLDEADYQRPGLRSDGAPFTVTTLSQYFVHDVIHHLADVRRQR